MPLQSLSADMHALCPLQALAPRHLTCCGSGDGLGCSALTLLAKVMATVVASTAPRTRFFLIGNLRLSHRRRFLQLHSNWHRLGQSYSVSSASSTSRRSPCPTFGRFPTWAAESQNTGREVSAMSSDTSRIRFGLWYDFRNPPQWRQPFDRLYGEILDQVAWAENNGFDDVWLSEHHFIEDGYLPSMLPAAAAIAARTRKIRIPMGVLLMPFHNPVR